MQPDYKGRFFGDQTYKEAFYTATFNGIVKEKNIKKVTKLDNKKHKSVIIKPKKYKYSGMFDLLIDGERIHFEIGRDIKKSAYLVKEIYNKEKGSIFDLNGILIKIINKSINRVTVKG